MRSDANAWRRSWKRSFSSPSSASPAFKTAAERPRRVISTADPVAASTTPALPAVDTAQADLAARINSGEQVTLDETLATLTGTPEILPRDADGFTTVSYSQCSYGFNANDVAFSAGCGVYGP